MDEKSSDTVKDPNFLSEGYFCDVGHLTIFNICAHLFSKKAQQQHLKETQV